MNLKAIADQRWFRPALGAAVTILCGLGLWTMHLGQRWINASYDYLFLFGNRAVTNKAVPIVMDEAARFSYKQPRGLRWDRQYHTQLLQKLTNDKCPLVICGIFFREEDK